MAAGRAGGLLVQGRTARETVKHGAEAAFRRHGREHSAGVPGLGEHEGRVSILRERTVTVGGTLLVLHDTTEFSYPRENIGLLHKGRRNWGHPLGCHPLCGISMHSSLVVTTAGLPLGLAAVKFWTRKAFKGTNELKRR